MGAAGARRPDGHVREHARRAADAAQESSVADSSGLESALAELRSDYAILKAAADDVTRRLDGTIVRVEAILAGRN